MSFGITLVLANLTASGYPATLWFPAFLSAAIVSRIKFSDFGEFQGPLKPFDRTLQSDRHTDHPAASQHRIQASLEKILRFPSNTSCLAVIFSAVEVPEAQPVQPRLWEPMPFVTVKLDEYRDVATNRQFHALPTRLVGRDSSN